MLGTRRCFTFLASCALLSLHACGSEGDDGNTDASSTGNQPVPCSTPAECPGADEFCSKRNCNDGVCGFDFTAGGTPLATDSVGDCGRRECDGAGAVTIVPDSNDPKSDGLECTVDSCNADGSTTFTAKAQGTACVDDGGKFCDDAGACKYCAPLDQACIDTAGEPNDAELTAEPLGAIGEAAPLRTCGVLPGADVDWYGFDAPEGVAGVSIAAVDVAQARVCAFVVCQMGDGAIPCPAGATEATSPDGAVGCCRDGSLVLPKGDLCPDAAGTALSVRVSVEDPGASASACLGYELAITWPVQ
ncbi:MAG: hypothetical protein WKG00_05875 [Polyangiaceae bacterium]